MHLMAELLAIESKEICHCTLSELEMGYDPTVHRIIFKDKIHYVYDLTHESGETLHFQTTKTIFNPRIVCISRRKMRVWRAIQVTGSDGLQEKGDKEVVLKDVWLDKGSPKEKENQQLIYNKLCEIREEENYGWIDVNYWEWIQNALANIPDSLPFMRILHDSEGVDCREHLKEASPDRTILSSPGPWVSSSRNVTPLTGQTENSYSMTSTSHCALATPDLRHHPQRQYKAKTQYRLVYAQVGYLPWLNTACADQHLPSPHSVISSWLGPQGYQYRQYHCCGE